MKWKIDERGDKQQLLHPDFTISSAYHMTIYLPTYFIMKDLDQN